MIIYASLELHGNISTVNHIWQAGPMSENTPMMHSVRPSSPNVKSMGCLDFLSGRVKATRSSSTTLKNVHGILNRVSWGILMPIGTVIARYLKRFESADPLWFYLHVSCQLLAFFFFVVYLDLGLGFILAQGLLVWNRAVTKSSASSSVLQQHRFLVVW